MAASSAQLPLVSSPNIKKLTKRSPCFAKLAECADDSAELYALQNWIVNGVPIPTQRDPSAQGLSMSWNVKPTQMLDMAFRLPRAVGGNQRALRRCGLSVIA